MNRLVLLTLTLALALGVTDQISAQDADTKKDAVKAADASDKDAKKSEEKAQKKEKKEKPEIKPLTIGSKAPHLDIEHWVQDGGGEFSKVTEFEKDKVYVVEFWATWCGPCISSMPHIAHIQDLYADRGVQVISISDEPLETIEGFLEREVRGSEEGKTYGELTRGYCLTTDPDRSVSRDYMRAANQNGIPCAFVVGKTGQIEWIGHPMSMDEPLEEIVSDKWDRDAFLVEFVAEQKASEVLSKLSGLMRAGKTGDAIELLDDYLEHGESAKQKHRFKLIKFQVMASDKEYAPQAVDFLAELMKDEALDASTANQLAWGVFGLADRGRGDEKLTRAALKLAQSKVKSAGENKAYLLDTVAHLQHVLGNSKQALKTQKRAVKAAAPEQKERLLPFLKELEELQEKDKEKPEVEAKVEGDEKPLKKGAKTLEVKQDTEETVEKAEKPKKLVPKPE